MKENIPFFFFVFLFIVFLLLLSGGQIIKSIKKAKKNAKKAADEKAQRFRDETGRQQRQYHFSGKTATEQQQPRSVREDKSEVPEEIRTKTATGETIIDRRKERDNRKIYDSDDGEYVEFSEE